MTKFRATMTVEYEVSDQKMITDYNTTDPYEAASIDQENFSEDPILFLEFSALSDNEVVVVKVEPIQ